MFLGDSGGPILKWTGRYWEQVGIVSYGDGCAEPGKPGIYTRLSYYYDWISDILQQDNEFIEPTMTYATTASTMTSTRLYNHARPFVSHVRSSQIMTMTLITILLLINKLRVILWWQKYLTETISMSRNIRKNKFFSGKFWNYTITRNNHIITRFLFNQYMPISNSNYLSEWIHRLKKSCYFK